jgi:hypothetical protein
MPRHRAFALADLAAATLTLGLVAALLLVVLTRTRSNATQAESLANLKFIGTVTASYGADYQDRVWGFSWQPGGPFPTTYPDLQAHASGDAFARAGAQAIDIIRRRSDLPNMQIISSWIPHTAYSHLVLADYLDSMLPLRRFVNPADRNRVRWSGDPAAFRSNLLMPQPDGSDPNGWRWPYSSSYELPPAFYSPNFLTTGVQTIIQAGSHNTFQITGTGTTGLGPRLLTDAVHPSQKVLLFENAQWHGARSPVYFAYPHARIAMVTVDGSGGVRATGSANRGFQPANPTSSFATSFTYSPSAWEPPVANNVTSVQGYYRWTRRGITGRDFDGQEVPAP